jgi:hypothetical protein
LNNKGENMKTLYVEYHSDAWVRLERNWITWEVFELNGVRIAKMLWTDNF